MMSNIVMAILIALVMLIATGFKRVVMMEMVMVILNVIVGVMVMVT